MNRKALVVLSSMLLAVSGMFLLTGANSPSKALTSTEQYNGYATGTDLYADALRLPGPNPTMELANVGLANSRSGVDSTGLKAINNEMGNAVVPTDLQSIKPGLPSTASANTYGGGSGLEVGLGTTLPNNPDLNQLILGGLAEQIAPCAPAGPLCVDGRMPPGSGPSGSVVKEIGPIPADPLLFASLLRGRAYANFDATDPCAISDANDTGGLFDTGLGNDLAYGQGDTAHVELLNTAAQPPGGLPNPLYAPLGTPNSAPVISTTGNQPPDRFVGTARSFTRLVPNGDGTFGLVSETHETFAPITLFKNSANQFTIELLGEWVLRVSATGKPGGTTVTYAPAGNPSPTTPLISITPPGMPTQIVLKTQDLFGPKAIPQHIDLMQLGNINIGEDPRGIGSDTANPTAPTQTADGTTAAAAVDVVRIKLLVPDPTSHLADIRIGHMEAKAQVPTGGVSCPSNATTTTGNGGGSTSMTAGNNNGTTTTTAANQNNGTTTTTEPNNSNNGTTTTTAANQNNGTTTTTSGNNGGTANNTAATEPPAQVQAVTFGQSPAATPQSQTPNFTG